MRIFILSILISLFSFTVGAQNPVSIGSFGGPASMSLSSFNGITNDTLYLRMYHNAIKYGDYRLAINSMQALYAMHPDSIKFLDSVCIMCSEIQEYAQCILTGNQVLKTMPDDIPTIEAVALSNQHVGRYEEALGLFQVEYEKNKSMYACYQIAVLQFSLQQNGKAQATLDRLISDKRAMTNKIGFSTSNNSTQQVFYKAAAENLMGVIYKDLKDLAKAKSSFEAALSIQPDFILAKNNLEALEKKGEK